jgi:hypothetical protein
LDLAPHLFEPRAVVVDDPDLAKEPGEEEQEPDEDDPPGASSGGGDLAQEALALGHDVLVAAYVADPGAVLFVDIEPRWTGDRGFSVGAPCSSGGRPDRRPVGAGRSVERPEFFENSRDGTEAQDVAVVQLARAVNHVSVDGRAVGRAQVLDSRLASLMVDRRVRSTDVWVVDAQTGVRRPPDH